MGVATIKTDHLRKVEQYFFMKMYSMYSKYIQGVGIFAKKKSNLMDQVLWHAVKRPRAIILDGPQDPNNVFYMPGYV